MKVYDCITYLNEEELLELRLNILNKYVDFFVICEAREDHRGNSKKLNFNINKFTKFKEKIIYLIVERFENCKRTWDRQNFQRDYLINGDFDGIAGALRATWEAKIETSDLVTNDLLNNIYASAIDAGASAGKVSGAGGGGFMMFLIPPEKRNDVINGLDKYNGVIRNCLFRFKGCEAWTIN